MALASMPHRFRFSLLLALLLAVLTPGAAIPHGGGLDTFGCHHDRKHGGYHCHRGALAGQQFKSQQDMLAALEPGQGEGPAMQEPQLGPRQIDKGETCIREKQTGKIVCGDLVPR